MPRTTGVAVRKYFDGKGLCLSRLSSCRWSLAEGVYLVIGARAELPCLDVPWVLYGWLLRARRTRWAAQMHAEMALPELRQALQLTQQDLAERLHLNQAAVSKLEHQSDMYVSTLRRFVPALGGELRIVAPFRQGDVVVSQFEDIHEKEPARTWAK